MGWLLRSGFGWPVIDANCIKIPNLIYQYTQYNVLSSENTEMID